MKRSKAFILSEQLMTIMLQAGFILVLCTSFYQVISFYTRTQQVLTARNHAERVISFMDDKIRHAGLGLWQCESADDIRGYFSIKKLKIENDNAHKLPISLTKYASYHNIYDESNNVPSKDDEQKNGDMLILLYAQRNLSSGGNEAITAFREAKTLTALMTEYQLILLDTENENVTKVQNLFDFSSSQYPEKNIKRYAVMESLGIPLYVESVCRQYPNHYVAVKTYKLPSSGTITVPVASELLTMNFMRMFVHGTTGAGEGRQFAYQELQPDGTGWDKVHNQEKGILDIYMELDTDKNMFTLWVLATGGYDESLNNPRPESWPKEATPARDTDEEAKTAWSTHEYSHHVVYVSRASWKLNNIPYNFGW